MPGRGLRSRTRTRQQEKVVLNAATQNARDTARAKPTIFTTLWQHSKRNEAAKKGQRQLYDNLISLLQRATESKKKAEAQKVNEAAKKTQ